MCLLVGCTFCASMFHYFNPFPTDVNSWLVTFGFQLYNVIPGYRKPNTEAMEPSYELIRTQIKTQEWDSTKVVTLIFHLSTSLFFPAFIPLLFFSPPLANWHALCSQIPRGGASNQAEHGPVSQVSAPHPHLGEWGQAKQLL